MTSGAYGGQPFGSTAPYTSAPLALYCRERVVKDPTLCGLALLVGLLPALLFGAIAAPALLLGATPSLTDPKDHLSTTVALVVAGILSGVLTLALSGGIVAAVSADADRQPVTVGGAMRVVARRWRPLLGWAVMRTVLSLATELLDRFGMLGRIVDMIGSIAFALATIFVLPAIVISGAMPGEAILTSSRMVKDTFGFTLTSHIRVLTPWLLVALISLILAIIGAVLAARYAVDVPTWSAAGVILTMVGTLGFFIACGFQTAVSASLNTLIYRHGIGLPTPGVDEWSLPRRRP
jgi:hypothetical protein